jgi:hypothetical protein
MYYIACGRLELGLLFISSFQISIIEIIFFLQSPEIVCNMRSRLEDGTELDFKKWPSSRASAHTILLG